MQSKAAATTEETEDFFSLFPGRYRMLYTKR